MIARFHYDDETLDRLLHDRLHDQERNVSGHVETCEQCQSRLETLSQQGLTWDEAGQMLRRDSLDEQPDATCDRMFLEPTNHPGSLGRFGRYEIMEFLGRGGMGIVMRGFDLALNRHSAIKVLAPELATSAASRKRFSREAKSAAAVVHPHVVPIQTVDEHDGLPYLVMPVIEGKSLQQRVDFDGPLEIVEVVRIAGQVAEGLAAAHDQGLVHRDIKPANILLENGVERVQITDFGLARAADDASMTRSGVIAGTPQYMSPEQAHGDTIDQRSDLFSLGSLIYFMLTGRSPFRAETTMGVLNRVANDDPRPLRSIDPNVPDWLQAIVTRLLAKQPVDRYQSAAEVAELLGRCLEHLQQPTTTPLPESLRVLTATQQGHRRPPWAKFIVAAVSGFAMFFAGFMIVLELSKGTLTIKSDAGDVPIRIMQGDQVVETMTVTRTGKSIRVAAGNYVVEIEGGFDDLVIQGGSVSLQRRGSEVVSIVRAEDAVRSTAVNRSSESDAPSDWKSTKDPSTVRRLANEDAKHGKYKQSLEKLLWYWENAVAIMPSHSAVRRSFLLSDWLELGESYPPALEKLRHVRDELKERILATDQIRVRSDDFADFVNINRVLREDQQSKDVYEKILARDPQDAKRLQPWLRFVGPQEAPNAVTNARTQDVVRSPAAKRPPESDARSDWRATKNPSTVLHLANEDSKHGKHKEVSRANDPVSQPDPDLIVVDAPGRWTLPGGARLTISSPEIEKFGKVYVASIRWPASGPLPALRHFFYVVKKEHTRWSVAWKTDSPILWAVAEGHFQSGSSIRSIDFSSPAYVVTSTQYGDDNFDLRTPELNAIQRSTRVPFSISGPGLRLPKDLDSLLTKRFGKGKSMKYGISSLLPTGLHSAGGQYAETAVTEGRWTIQGQVRDGSGNPIYGVAVEARTEFHPTITIASTTTGVDGSYVLSFHMDLRTLYGFRGVTVQPKLQGFAETSASRDGEFNLLQADEEDTAAVSRHLHDAMSQLTSHQGLQFADVPEPKRFSDRIAVLGKTSTADFVMLPATTVQGHVKDAQGEPIPKAFVSLRLPGQRPGYSLASTTADEAGRFQLEGLLAGTHMELVVNEFQRPSETATIDKLVLPHGRFILMDLIFENADGTRSLSIRNLNSLTDSPPPESAD